MNQKKEISIVLERISAYLSTLLLQEKIIKHFQSVKINQAKHLFLPLCQIFIDK